MLVKMESNGSGGGGNKNLFEENGGLNPVTYTTNQWIDTGVKATDAQWVFLLTNTNTYNATLGLQATVSGGVVTKITSDYGDVQVNGSGNIEVKCILGTATYPTINIYVF